MKEAPIISRPVTREFEDGYEKVWEHCQHLRRVRADEGDGWVCLQCGMPMNVAPGQMSAWRNCSVCGERQVARVTERGYIGWTCPNGHDGVPFATNAATASVEQCPICDAEHEIKRATVKARFVGLDDDGEIVVQTCPNLPRDTFVPMKDGRPVEAK